MNAFAAALNAYLIKHGNSTTRTGDGSIHTGSDGPNDNYIVFWNTAVLGPAPTVDDGFTSSQLRALPNIPNLKTQTAKEDFQVALNQLSRVVRLADEMLKLSNPIAGNRPLIRKDLRGAIDPLEKLQRVREIFNEIDGQLFAGGHAPFFQKFSPSYKKSLLSVLPENSQNLWSDYNSALYKLTLAVSLVQDAERHENDNDLYNRTVKNAEMLADEFAKVNGPIREWENYAIKRLDLLANSI